MSNKKSIKALEELVKTEYMAVAALDAALEEADDTKLRRQYKKFRDQHVKQAEALNDRLEDLGGEPLDYEVGTGKGQASLWGRITGAKDETSIAGMRIGAERGVKRYIDNIDDVEDGKALNIIRKNLEAKQDEMRWYDEQASKVRETGVDRKLENSKGKSEIEEKLDYSSKKKKGGLPFPLILLVGAAAGAAYFLMKRNDDSEFDDYGEDAFSYEGEGGESSSAYSSSAETTTFAPSDSTGDSTYNASTSHGSE